MRQYVRRMVGAKKREIYERNVTESFRAKYQKVQELRTRMAEGDLDVEDEWMAAAGDLVQDFRSFRNFYPWDKYLSYMGFGSFFKENKRPDPANGGEPQAGERTREGTRAETVAPQGQEELAAMADRLQKSEFIMLFIMYIYWYIHTDYHIQTSPQERKEMQR
jgi:general transcription factor 3C polypeptide 3 (transcription factor C subunit 4)